MRDKLLGSSFAPVKSLQYFAGKSLSFSLAIPVCKLHVQEVLKAIRAVARNSKISDPIQGHLGMDFPGQMVRSLTLAIGASSLSQCSATPPRGPGSSLDRRRVLSFLIVYSDFLFMI